jgi:hypothetical protein
MVAGADLHMVDDQLVTLAMRAEPDIVHLVVRARHGLQGAPLVEAQAGLLIEHGSDAPSVTEEDRFSGPDDVTHQDELPPTRA